MAALLKPSPLTNNAKNIISKAIREHSDAKSLYALSSAAPNLMDELLCGEGSQPEPDALAFPDDQEGDEGAGKSESFEQVIRQAKKNLGW